MSTPEEADHKGLAPPAVFTVPMGAPFLDTVAHAVLSGNLPHSDGAPPDPLNLPDVTLLLPTRRAARAMQDAFLRAAGGRALLLPRIRPIAEGDEDRTLISGLAAGESFEGDLSLPPQTGELERRLLMTTLVQRWSEAIRAREEDSRLAATVGARTPAQAAQLASELCQLIDMIETENKSLAGLSGLVPEEFAEHWKTTLEFLEIVVTMWPEHLAEINKLSPADRRNRLIRSEAVRLRDERPDTPVIIAGVTGSIPATAELMKAVAGLPNGAIVLPGLDSDLDEETWRDLARSHPEHPQFGLARLLGTLGAERSGIRSLRSEKALSHYPARARILSESMRPPSSTDRWHKLSAEISDATARAGLQDITYLAMPTAQDEAEAIALILRQVAEAPERTAALVSPDRLLARRVAARLETWGIRVDDSAGRPFAKTVPGSFLDLVIEVAAQDFAPKPLMSLLKHPLARLGMPARDIRRAARALEIIAFRTAYLGYGLDGLDAAVELAAHDVQAKRRRGSAVNRLWDADWQGARDLVARLRAAYAPLLAFDEHTSDCELRLLANAHVETAQALAATSEEDKSATQLWRDEAGQTAALLFAQLNDDTLTAPRLAVADYPDFYRALIGAEAVRPTIPTHPRISIWGPFEARLQRPDVVILGALNEGTWPAAADPGPWLNRPMRDALGLPLPEERIGHAAHDLVQLFGAERVYLTRAAKADGDPTVPSRWLLRLEAVIGALGVENVLAPRQPWLAWARHRDASDRPNPMQAPRPKPPLELRPRRMSVSDIETWIRNPYGIFARRILGLEDLPALGEDPDASLRGSIVHDALGRFAVRYPEHLPAAIGKELSAISREIFERYRSHPRIRAFWVGRFERFAEWFDGIEPGLREGVTRTLAEVTGAHVFDAPGGPFTLTARADRIDITHSGIEITDYKTASSLDTLRREAKSGIAPQLLLEAVIARELGFPGVTLPPAGVEKLRYISASGGEPPGQVVTVDLDDVSAAADKIKAELAALVALFDDPETPYKAVRRPNFDYRYDAYAHLARVAEWSGEAGGEEQA